MTINRQKIVISDNQLKDWHEKESLRIAKEFDVITFEDVNMQSMAQMNHGKKVLNNGFGQFRVLVERKSNEHLREFIKANKWFPSSQICNICGFRNPITKDLQKAEKKVLKTLMSLPKKMQNLKNV